MWPMSGLSLVCWKKKVFGGKIKWCEKKTQEKTEDKEHRSTLQLNEAVHFT